MPTRSVNIVSKVLRNLKRHDVKTTEILDAEIYSEMESGQDAVISEVFPDRNITITLKEDVETYPLTSETVTDPDLTTYKNNIASVKVVKQPSGFLYPFRVVSNSEFVKLIDGNTIDWIGAAGTLGVDISDYLQTGIALVGVKNGVNRIFTIPDEYGIVEDSEAIYFNGVRQTRDVNYTILNTTITVLGSVIPNTLEFGHYQDDTLTVDFIHHSALGNSVVGTVQPLLGTVIGGRLKVYPIPNASHDGIGIELYAYQKSSAGVINGTTAPELDNEWDKALEAFTTAQFLSGKDRQQWLNEFERERDRLKLIPHMKRGTIQRAGVFDGIDEF